MHLIADSYATHKHAKVQAWLKRHPRFHMHFAPTSASWIHQVERFFGLITEDRIRRGVFKSVAELHAAIEQLLETHNADPRPFVWTASAITILEKVSRGRQTLESDHKRRIRPSCGVRIPGQIRSGGRQAPHRRRMHMS